MLHVEVKRKKERLIPGYLISLFLIAGILGLFIVGTRGMADRTDAERLEVLNQAIQRATIQCYAIEGRYPPSVEYLEEHYGLTIDREQFHVFYDGWASNIMPEITIFPVEDAEEGI